MLYAPMTPATETALQMLAHQSLPKIEFAPSVLTPQYSTLIGDGSYGSVFHLKHLPHLAMKVIEITPQNGNQVEAVVREIRKLHQLQHPHIVQIHAYFCPPEGRFTGSHIGFFMDYAMYGSLAHVIDCAKRHQLNFEITWLLMLEWLKQIAMAIAFMHSKCEKHKDLKPENILVTQDLVIKLCDFGLTRNHGKSHSVQKGLGSYGYMAIEIARGEESQFASDIYSYAITVGFLLAWTPNPREFKGRRDKAERLNQWMKSSPYLHQRGFDRLLFYVLKGLHDDWMDRPSAAKVVEIISEIQQGKVDITVMDTSQC